jgi:hypothetical protein
MRTSNNALELSLRASLPIFTADIEILFSQYLLPIIPGGI